MFWRQFSQPVGLQYIRNFFISKLFLTLAFAMFLPGEGAGQMSGFLGLGPSNVQTILFLSSSPPGLPHELIQKLLHLDRLAGGQLVAELWQEGSLAEVSGEAQS